MPDLTILSLGAGVQSSTLYRLAAEGEIGPMPDYAIFADTQQEPRWVYDQLDLLEREYNKAIPIIRATAGDLGEAIENATNVTGERFASIPFWSEGEDGREAPGRRHCTREYKIDVVKLQIRTLLGLQPGQRAKGAFEVEEWVGISKDEATRAKPSRYDWITTRWPLLFDRPMTRQECIAWHERRGYPVPKKSACVFCPYRGALEFDRWRREEPDLFEEACKWDEKIRSGLNGTLRGMKRPQYILRILIPLRELPEDVGDDPQLNLFEMECEGMCGI